MGAPQSTINQPNAAYEFPTPRTAYIHVPFCRHRCGYCNFTLMAGRDDLIEDYLRVVESEIRRLGTAQHVTCDYLPLVGGAHPKANEVDTLYFGGGTPTHLSPEQLRRLAKVVLQRHPLAGGYEWTVEANPSDVNQNMIGALSEMGVTRLSL